MKNTKAHIAGIGGEGWSWIAKVLIERGWEVTGCDLECGKRVGELKQLGLKRFLKGHSTDHITADLDYFLYSSALLSHDIPLKEINYARSLGTKVLDRTEFLPELLEENNVVAITGTHGKTTTSSIVAYLLNSFGDKCGFGVGGTVRNFNTNGRNGDSNTFVLEADEFADAFLGVKPYIGVITSLEMDHHDYFKDFDTYTKSFKKFASNINTGGQLIMWGDGTPVEELKNVTNSDVITYGECDGNDVRILSIDVEGFDTKWSFDIDGDKFSASVPFPGKQYAYNATAALLVCKRMGFDIKRAISLLGDFKGAGRRFEYHEKNGITIVNDYAHHPTEVQFTVEAAKSTGKRVIVVFEPHQYKRSAELKDEFIGVFDGVDLLQTEIFASREDKPHPITNEEFFDVTKSNASSAKYVGQYINAVDEAVGLANSGDLVLVLAVGHGDQIVAQMLESI